jgi:hypothetical protein
MFGACHEKRTNDSEIDKHGPTDSKKCLSEEARRRLVKAGQKSNRIASESGEEDLGLNCKTEGSRNALKGFRKTIEEQEFIGYEPKIIEMAILVEECANDMRAKKCAEFILG